MFISSMITNVSYSMHNSISAKKFPSHEFKSHFWNNIMKPISHFSVIFIWSDNGVMTENETMQFSKSKTALIFYTNYSRHWGTWTLM